MPEVTIEAIREIISIIGKGLIFDSHFIIDRLILTNTRSYYGMVRAMPNAEANQVHGRIARTIGEQTDLVKSVGRSYSLHIHGEAGECEAWQRI